MNILVITDSPSTYKVTFLEMIAEYHSIDVFFQNTFYSHRDKRWFKKSELLHCINLSDSKVKRLFEVLNINTDKYDIFWNMNYTSWECIITAMRFRIHKKLNLMHADGGIYKDFGFFINKGIEIAMKLNHYFTSSGIMTTDYYLKRNISLNKIFHYTFSSVLENDIPSLKECNEAKSKDKFEILSVGQQINRKGYDILLKAVKDIDNIYVTIVGGQPNKECSLLMNELNLYSKVEFIPFVPFDELKQYYLNSDLFVLPTREDIWGLVMNEAMIFGLPLIGTKNCVAAVEFESRYQNCICVEVDDVEGLKDAILEVITDEKLRNFMRKQSIEHAKEVTIDCMVKDYICIFEEIKGKIL